MAHNKRKVSCTVIDGVKYKQLTSLSEREDGSGYIRQAPTGIDVMGRILGLTRDGKLSKTEAYKLVAQELSEFWIFGLNVYPLGKQNIVEMLKHTYEGSGGFKSLVDYPVKKEEKHGKRRPRALMRE